MEKPQPGFLFIGSAAIILGLAAFTLCLGAEYTRTKKVDVKLDGTSCSLPGSRAYGLGLAALACLCTAQMIGNVIACRQLCMGEKRSCNIRRPKMVVSTFLCAASWISFGITCIILGTATSMNKKQPYGRGWLNNECYVVRNGMFIGSAMLVVLNIATTLSFTAVVTRKRRGLECGQKVHAQGAAG